GKCVAENFSRPAATHRKYGTNCGESAKPKLPQRTCTFLCVIFRVFSFVNVSYKNYPKGCKIACGRCFFIPDFHSPIFESLPGGPLVYRCAGSLFLRNAVPANFKLLLSQKTMIDTKSELMLRVL